MDLKKLFFMQKELDAHIEHNHQLQEQDLFDKKILALLVELGELANETRCFKFWSLKPPASKETILEEYVDGLHFILSLGLEGGFENHELQSLIDHSNDLSKQFLKVFDQISAFRITKQFHEYELLFQSFLSLGVKLGYKEHEIEKAYFQKNEVNYERQEEGY